MLCLQPECWKSKNRLYEFNKDRDNSMKRYLREDPDYGKSIQIFIKHGLIGMKMLHLKNSANT